MNISTNDKIDLCTIVAGAISEIAKRQGKTIDPEYIFCELFDGDYCDTFDNILESL